MCRHAGTTIPSGRHRSVSTTHMTVWRRVVTQWTGIGCPTNNYPSLNGCLLTGRFPVTVHQTVVKRLDSQQETIIQCIMRVKAEMWKSSRGKIVSVADFLMALNYHFNHIKRCFVSAKTTLIRKRAVPHPFSFGRELFWCGCPVVTLAHYFLTTKAPAEINPPRLCFACLRPSQG